MMKTNSENALTWTSDSNVIGMKVKWRDKATKRLRSGIVEGVQLCLEVVGHPDSHVVVRRGGDRLYIHPEDVVEVVGYTEEHT